MWVCVGRECGEGDREERGGVNEMPRVRRRRSALRHEEWRWVIGSPCVGIRGIEGVPYLREYFPLCSSERMVCTTQYVSLPSASALQGEFSNLRLTVIPMFLIDID